MKTPKIQHVSDFAEISAEGGKALVVTDSNVAPLYADALCAALEERFSNSVTLVVLPAGERNKNRDAVESVYSGMHNAEMSRDSVLFALGGGVVCDIAGYAAATFKRGVRLCMVPTTLMAMVDAAIGGKNGYNEHGVKNLIGSFYQPELVCVNINTLASLPETEYISALAEVIKYGVVVDWIFFDYFAEKADKIIGREPAILDFIVRHCIRLKHEIVLEDERDFGRRRILNFGHTIGHAVEAGLGYSLPHGHCVAIGMAAAARISVRRGLLRENAALELENLLRRAGLPVSISGLDEAGLATCLAQDKKGCFILLDDIGRPREQYGVGAGEALEAVRGGFGRG